MSEYCIITTSTVDKTKSGEDCLLRRRITRVIKENNQKRYISIIERCNFYTEDVPKYDEATNKPVLDADGNQVFESITVLKTYGIKDTSSTKTMSFAEIDGFSQLIGNSIPEGLSEMETENTKELLALLQMTKTDLPYGTAADDWIIYNQ